MTDSLDRTLTLEDGRTLGYREYGDPAGIPIFYFHGFPGSRIEARYMDEPGKELKARIIALDRPGMGLSSFQPRRRLVDWPLDVAQAADLLGIHRFSVAGMSGGGPYAAACARRLEDRLSTATIISGLGPLTAPGIMKGMSTRTKVLSMAAVWARPVAQLTLWLLGRSLHNREKSIEQIYRSANEADRSLLDERPEIAEGLYESMREAYRQGAKGPRRELSLYARPWGLRLDRIRAPVFIYQGEADGSVPPTMARYQAERIPGSKATYWPGEGHFAGVRHAEDILDAIVSAAG